MHLTNAILRLHVSQTLHNVRARLPLTQHLQAHVKLYLVHKQSLVYLANVFP